MGEPRGELPFAEEAGAQRGVPGEVVAEELDRDGPLQLLVASQDDGRHAATAELALEPVTAVPERPGAQSPSP
jgi:hypothetical protein